MKYDICVIGGGASGLAAAVTAGGSGKRVLVIEKKNRCAAKVAASGNGRCNLSNLKCEDWSKTSAFFSSIGLVMRSDPEGRIYPYSEDGRDVADCLIRAARAGGAEIVTDAEVLSVSAHAGGGFRIETKRGEFESSKVLIASGGKAAPKFGTTGDGFRIARSLGHTVSRLSPVLTAVETEDTVRSLAGVRAKCEAKLFENGTMKFSERGEVQFTDYGLSGICIFDMSRFMDIPGGMTIEDGFGSYEIELDLAPAFPESELARAIAQNTGIADGPALMNSIIKKPLAEYVFARACSAPEGDAGGTYSDTEVDTNSDSDVYAGVDIPGRLAAELKGLAFRPKKLRGWDHAEVTRGGVPQEEVDDETMESKIVPGLYFAGEVLDYDGPTGGYNLQHAWITGIKAGRAMAE